MADTGESSSSSSSSPHLNPPPVVNKPVIVRVKRKPSQSPLEAFWLEINERPHKRPLLDLAKLSISESTGKKDVSEEFKPKKVFVQHVETVKSSKATIDVLHSFVPNSADASEFRTKIEERRQTFKQENKQEQLLSRARENHEVLAKNARFEQIWKKRKGNKDDMHDGSFHELCSLYDVVRVDEVEGETFKVEEPDDTSLTLEDSTLLYNYLPLIREYLPSVAAEIQSDMQAYFSEQEDWVKQRLSCSGCALVDTKPLWLCLKYGCNVCAASTDDYVYDLYAVQDELKTPNEDTLNTYPLVQVAAEDDFFDGPNESEYDSEDSNAEDNPLNDYPDEEESEEDEEEDKSRASLDESDEVESRSSSDHHEERHNRKYSNLSEDEYGLYEEEEMLGVEDGDEDDGESEDDWKWKHR